MGNRVGCALDPNRYHCACFDRKNRVCTNANFCEFKKKEKEPKWFEKYYKKSMYY